MVFYLAVIGLLFALPTVVFAQFQVEGKLGCFRPTDATTREIFKPGVVYTFEAAAEITSGLHAWANINCFVRTGKSPQLADTVKLAMVPFGLGLKGVFDMSQYARISLGAGVLPTYIGIKTITPTARLKVSQWTCGGVLKGSVLFMLPYKLFVDCFMDYYVLQPKGKNTANPVSYGCKAKFDGLVIGLGLGMQF